jgi:hypothetical protein
MGLGTVRDRHHEIPRSRLPGVHGNASRVGDDDCSLRAGKISACNLAVYCDPAAILVDQSKEIFIDGGGAADDQVKIAPFEARLVAGLQGVGRSSATTGLVAAATGEPNSRSISRPKPLFRM